VTQAFVPVLEAGGGGTIVNTLSLLSLAPVTGMSPYCASKAASHSFTQSLRHELADRGIAVLGVYPGPMGTPMLDGVKATKARPEAVAKAILDARWLSTLDAITEELVSDGLVYRYDPGASPDGLKGSEGTFSICSFWWVEALTRAGRLDEAQVAFEKMLTYANHGGLYSEEIGPLGEALGNFPQAFSHLALISCALNLDRALG
jgi:hypothetical protein